MTHYYTSSTDGNNAYDGLAPLWTGVHGPKLTITAGEALLAAGDTHHVRPGVYRETVTWGVSGGNAYQVGTVNVTNGSVVVTGVGTLWLANVAADYMFHNIIFASGTDGVTNGTATFTSAAGNFQAAMVGQIIQINTRGAYKIDAVGGLNTITLSDPNGLGWPAAAVGLSYSVMSGMEPFDVLSVDGNTQLTLTAPWYGPTLTGLAYITYNPIRAIGDVAGQIWGVGGAVRITGSDDDISATRVNCVALGARAYRILRGFAFDLPSSSALVSTTSPSYVTIEDCTFQSCGANPIDIRGATQAAITIRRCTFYGRSQTNFRHILFLHSANISNVCHLISNCRFISGVGTNGGAVHLQLVGGVSIRNSLFIGNTGAIRAVLALTAGQTIVVSNCIIQGNSTAFQAVNVGDVTENFNALSENSTSYTNVAAGAGTLAYPPIFSVSITYAGQAGISGFRLPPPLLGELSQWSPIKALAGFGEPPADIFGLKRPATSVKNSWGAVQYQNLTYDTTTVRTAGGKSLELSDAGRAQVILASTNRPLKVRVYVYREANYAGINPQLIIKQPGQADVVITDAGGLGVWNALEASLTPTAYPGFVVVEYVSNNTALAGAYAVYFDDSMISSFYGGGKMDSWVSDVQPANTPTTSGVSRAFAANGEGR